MAKLKPITDWNFKMKVISDYCIKFGLTPKLN